MLFVKRSEVCRDQMRKVVGESSDNLTSIPHPYELPQVLKLETAVSRASMYCVVLVTLEVKPFPSPVDLNVAFRVKCADEGCRALKVASVDWGSEFVFVAELEFRSLTGTPSRHPLLRKIIELLRSMLWTIATICSPDT